MQLNALILNCTLKYSPAVSNTEALVNKVCKIYKELDVNCEILRLTDYNIRFPTNLNELIEKAKCESTDKCPERHGQSR
ncbi:hypothetical protein [Candidiatus Paracoxiella cheracis]|uniref:hypothetical protein n=1 Tax=Candidiatus Paracoxiella cheracis TaxID=3405120 RepID=UPI003BF59E05